jgi:hypothetical protein
LYVDLETNGPSRLAKEGVKWAKVGKRFTCKVSACDVFYMAKWLLWKHFVGTHHLAMEQGKSFCPSTLHEGPRCQDHASMNAKVLANPLAQLQQNDQKANAHTKGKAIEEWEQLQPDTKRFPLVSKTGAG